MTWAIFNTIGVDCLQEVGLNSHKETLNKVGCWAAFMNDTSKTTTEKANIEYIQVISFPHDDSVVIVLPGYESSDDRRAWPQRWASPC